MTPLPFYQWRIYLLVSGATKEIIMYPRPWEPSHCHPHSEPRNVRSLNVYTAVLWYIVHCWDSERQGLEQQRETCTWSVCLYADGNTALTNAFIKSFQQDISFYWKTDAVSDLSFQPFSKSLLFCHKTEQWMNITLLYKGNFFQVCVFKLPCFLICCYCIVRPLCFWVRPVNNFRNIEWTFIKLLTLNLRSEISCRNRY